MMGLGLWIFNEKIGKTTEKSENSNSALYFLIQQVLSQLKLSRRLIRKKASLVHFDKKQQTARFDELT